MQLEKLMQTAEEQGISKGDFLNQIQEKYMYFVREHKFDRVKNLQKILGVDPELPEDFVQEQYRIDTRDGWVHVLEELNKLSGIDFNFVEEDVQEGYISCIRKDTTYNLEKLKELTGIEPKVPKNIVLELFREEIKSETLYVLKDVLKFTGIKIPEKEVQEAYNYLHNEGYLGRGRISDLIKITGIEPKIIKKKVKEVKKETKEDIQKKHIKFFKNNKFYEMERLEKETGVKPKLPENIVQDRYSIAIESEHYPTLEEIEKLTGIKISEDIVQNRYRKIIEKEWFSDNLDKYKKLRKLREATSIELNVPENIVQQDYIKCIKMGPPFRGLLNLKELQELTGIEPKFSDFEDVIQKEYVNHIKHGLHARKHSKDMQKVTGIEPKFSEADVQEGYIKCIESGCLDNFKDLHDFTGIAPSEETVQTQRIRNINDKDLFRFGYWGRVTDIEPSKEVYKTLVDFLAVKEEVGN